MENRVKIIQVICNKKEDFAKLAGSVIKEIELVYALPNGDLRVDVLRKLENGEFAIKTRIGKKNGNVYEEQDFTYYSQEEIANVLYDNRKGYKGIIIR